MRVLLPRQSLEYVLFPLDTSPVDASTLTHEVAIVATDAQPSGWVTVTYTDPNVEVLVAGSAAAATGSEDFTLDVGRWRIWWRASSNPEEPVRSVGIIQVT